jgi:hypothetical protein
MPRFVLHFPCRSILKSEDILLKILRGDEVLGYELAA